MRKKCIIYGAGTYGQVYAVYLKDEYNVIGYIDDDQNMVGNQVEHLPVLGDSKYLFSEVDKNTAIFVPIGNNEIRVELLEKLNKSGFPTPSFIHKETQIHKTVSIGVGVYVLPSTSIMPYTTIGDFTMISMGVNIAHHVIIDKGCFFSQGSNIGASIHFKEQAYCGIASTIMTGVKIVGSKSLIGAGAVIIRDVQAGATVVGNPGRVV